MMTEPYRVPTGANNTPLPSRGPAKAKASKGHRQRPEPLFDNLQDLQKAARKLRLSKRELAKLPKEERLRNKRDRKALKTDRKRLRKELVKEKHRTKAQAKKSQDRKDGEPPKAFHDASMETVGDPEESVNKDAESVVKSAEAPAEGVVKIIVDDKPAEKPSKVQPPHLTPKERKAERAAKRAQQKIERDARKKAKLAARAVRKAERAAAKAKGEDQNKDKEDHDDNDDDEEYSTVAANDGDDVSVMVDDKPAKKQAKTPRRAAKEQTAATLGKNPKNKLKYDKNKERNAERKRQLKLAKTISVAAKDAADSSAADIIPVGTTATPSTSAQAVANGEEISKKRKRENKKNEGAADAKEEKESKKAAAKEIKRAKKAETKVEQVVKAEVKKIETEDYIPL
ncbi:hypothetical protein V1520DRAFT_334326 [Lipomyces starkeyi]|uniref:Uncharacterized protein n=1 Tax=Lipomyces starkeyi NRRL Y-11557 TaxID=675824 RepID=A0A1E3Q4B3_LIPST|nr:hypothetical protein LIPSTDRAFT_111690 [Lipomyces starkeyi NRRL Y-11557]